MRKLLLSLMLIGLATPSVAAGCRFTQQDLPESEGGQIGPNSFLVVLDFGHIKFDDGRICPLALDDAGVIVADGATAEACAAFIEAVAAHRNPARDSDPPKI